MAINYIQPNTPLNASLLNDLYSEFDRKINLITNNKSILFLNRDLVGRSFYFFDGAQQKIGTTGLAPNVDEFICTKRVPNGAAGWYSHLFETFDISNEYNHAVFESLIPQLVLAQDITGPSQCSVEVIDDNGLEGSLAIHRKNGPFYRVTGIQIINSGLGYLQGVDYFSFPHRSGFGPYKEGLASVLTESGELSPSPIVGMPKVSVGTYFGSPPDSISVTLGSAGAGFSGIPLVEEVSVTGIKLNPRRNGSLEFINSKVHQAELIFEGSSSFTFPKEYDRYKFFRIHNLNNHDLNFTFEPGDFGMDTSAGDSFSLLIPKNSSRCVRRDFGKYTNGYTHFQKIISGDGRFDGEDDLDKYDEAFNNVYHPIEHALSYYHKLKGRFTIDMTKHWNSESLYYGNEKPFKEKNDNTLWGDLIYHTGHLLSVSHYTGVVCEGELTGYYDTRKINYVGGEDPLTQLGRHIELSGIPSGVSGFHEYCLSYTGLSGSCNPKIRQTRYINLKIHLLENDRDFYSLCGTNGIDESLVQAQINVLNTAFSNNDPNPYIQFKWDQNLITTDVGNTGWVVFNEGFKTVSPSVNTYEYLNLWIFECTGTGCRSFATYPASHGGPMDGIALQAQNLLSNSCFYDASLGKVLVHEVGHYLGLQHLWGDGGCSFDDGIYDTPTQSGEIYGCPVDAFACDGVTPALINNYMGYTNDACLSNFTTGQTDWMNAALDMERNTLFSGACTGRYIDFFLRKASLFPYTTNIIDTSFIGSHQIYPYDGSTCINHTRPFTNENTYYYYRYDSGYAGSVTGQTENLFANNASYSLYAILGELNYPSIGIGGPNCDVPPQFNSPQRTHNFFTYQVIPDKPIGQLLFPGGYFGCNSPFTIPLLQLSGVNLFSSDHMLINVITGSSSLFQKTQKNLKDSGDDAEYTSKQLLTGNFEFLGAELTCHSFCNIILHRSGGLDLTFTSNGGIPTFTFLKSRGSNLYNNIVYDRTFSKILHLNFPMPQGERLNTDRVNGASDATQRILSALPWPYSKAEHTVNYSASLGTIYLLAHSPRTPELYFSGTELSVKTTYLHASLTECEPTPPPSKANFPVYEMENIYLMRGIYNGVPSDVTYLKYLDDFLKLNSSGCVYLDGTGYNLLSSLMTY